MSNREASDNLEDLERSECLRLLGRHGLGRIGVIVRTHPVIVPVNYSVSDGEILVSIRRGGDLERATVSSIVAFEVDGKDNVYHEGWSVLVIGESVHMTPDARDPRAQQVALSSWAGDRDMIVRIAMDEVSGRRIRHHQA